MPAIDEIFEILTNGDWHEITEIAEKVGAPKSKIELVSSFLSAYSFLVYDKKIKRIKLSTEMKVFFRKIRIVEQKEAAEKKNLS